MFWCWDPAAEGLTDVQLEDNRLRLEQALDFYCGAVVRLKEAAKVETAFPAPFDASCADVCLQQLTGYDQANGTVYVTEFHLMAMQQMKASGTLDEMLRRVGHASSAAQLNIPPAARQQIELIPEPVVPASGDSHLSLIHPEDEGTVLNLTQEYPLGDPELSLHRLNSDIRLSGMKKAEFAIHSFGHNNGQQLSRHLKKLRSAVDELVAA